MKIVCTTLFGYKKLVEKTKLKQRKSVYAVIISQGKILLLNTKSTSKLWFPGGVVDPGETEKEALKRECFEEAGIIIKVGALLTAVESFFYYDPSSTAFHQISTFYLCTATSNNLDEFQNPDPSDEASNPEWKVISELNEKNLQDYGYEVIKLTIQTSSVPG